MPSQITERELAGELAAKLTEIIQQGGTPFEKATVEHHVGVGYPDITIWINYEQRKAFAFMELKSPRAEEDLSKLPAKAHALGVNFLVVWNFQHGELYEVKGNKLEQRKSYPTPILNSLNDWANETKRIGVIEEAHKILNDLVQLERQETLTPYVPDKFYFIGILQRAIHKMQPALQKHLFEAKKDKNIRQKIDAWAATQGYQLGLAELDELLSRHWAYSIAVRILFYFTIRRYYQGLPDIKPAAHSAQPISDLLWDAFSKAQQVDWQAVFERSTLDNLGIPAETEPILHDLLDDFNRYDFGQLREDVIGQIMEGLIPEEDRHALGQYFTREDLVDFITGFVADKDDAYYMDPTCGSGTFLNRLYSRLRLLSGYKADHDQILEQIWGIDIAHFPAELATINLFRQDVKNLKNFPRIVVKDFFDIQPEQSFLFPPPIAINPDYSKIEIQLPTFHGMVGNFPYIRQELIERQNKGYKKKIVKSIAKEWFWRDPELFKTKIASEEEYKKILEGGNAKHSEWLKTEIDKERIDLRLSGQADIYAYLFYHSASFLNEGGRIGIVTSNSWLDTAYGKELKWFFLRHFKIIAIVASWCEPWFEDAAVNTAFAILERCENPEERAHNIVRFVKVKKPLSELLPRELLFQEPERWRKVDAMVRQIESVNLQPAQGSPITGERQPMNGVHTIETEDFRIRLVPQSKLEEELKSKNVVSKWGLYIRAPQVYFDIIQNAGGKLVTLEKLAHVRFGIKTGVNDFFYLRNPKQGTTPNTLQVENARGWTGEIEKDCLRPIIKSPKEAKGLTVDPSDLKNLLFLPPVDPSAESPEQELRARYPMAYKYVEWGEQQRTTRGLHWHQVPSVKGHKAWWIVREATCPNGMWPKAFNNKFQIIENINQVFSSDRFHELTATEKTTPELLIAILNTSIVTLFIETNGRVNLGEGALDNMTYEVKQCLVPDTSQDSLSTKKILDAYQKLKKRPVKPIAQEVKQKDRIDLDTAVLEAIGLDPNEYLPKIYNGLVEMVEERLNLPKMRASRKKREKKLSIEQITKQIQNDVIPNGLKPITAFLPSGKHPSITLSVIGRPIRWQSFLTEITLLDEEGNQVGIFYGDEQQACYAIYAAKPGVYTLEIPDSTIVTEKTIQNYERYLREEVGRKLFDHARDVTRDHNQAEKIARDILQGLLLPPLAIEKAMEL